MPWPSNTYIPTNISIPVVATPPRPQGNYAVTVPVYNYAPGQLNIGVRHHVTISPLPYDNTNYKPMLAQKVTQNQTVLPDDYNTYLGPIPTQTGS